MTLNYNPQPEKGVVDEDDVCSDTYRDDSEHSVDHASSDGGVDGLSHASSFKYSCGIVEHLKEKTTFT